VTLRLISVEADRESSTGGGWPEVECALSRRMHVVYAQSPALAINSRKVNTSATAGCRWSKAA
jgi:hypothetical protein